MVKLNKSALPAGAKIHSRDDWRPGTIVRDILNADCHAKCYICEAKPVSADELTVDHVRPIHTNPTLEFAWGNLLLACAHCNGVKGSDYGDVINPSGENGVDPETAISFSFGSLSHIEVTGRNAEKSVMETVRLLNAVFNAEGSGSSFKLGCTKLRGKLNKERIDFELYISHADEPAYADMIKESINRDAPFTAFKRRIIRDDAGLFAKFGTALA